MTNNCIYVHPIKREFWYLISLSVSSLLMKLIKKIRKKVPGSSGYDVHAFIDLSTRFLTSSLVLPLYYFNVFNYKKVKIPHYIKEDSEIHLNKTQIILLIFLY